MSGANPNFDTALDPDPNPTPTQTQTQMASHDLEQASNVSLLHDALHHFTKAGEASEPEHEPQTQLLQTPLSFPTSPTTANPSVLPWA